MGPAIESGATLEEIAALYRARLPVFRRVARGILGDADAARDAVQDAFARAVVNRDGFRREGSLEGWLWRAVVNAARMQQRAARRRPAEPLDEADQLATRNGHESGSDPRLRAAVAALPERQRQMVFLRYYAGLDYATIAEALEVSAGTVAATLSSARSALRRSVRGGAPMMDDERALQVLLDPLVPEEEAVCEWADVLHRVEQITERDSPRRLVTRSGVSTCRSRARGEHWLWRRTLLAAVAVAALAGSGVAIAAGFGAFHGISAAQRPQTPADRIDPKQLAEINAANANLKGGPGQLLPDSARLVKAVSGARIYVVATNTGQLCVLADRKIGGAGMGCGSPLTQSQPTTAASFSVKHERITWGITVGGVTAVSFIAGGKKVTVPVVHNVWVYQGNYTGVPTSLTVHQADGSTETVPK